VTEINLTGGDKLEARLAAIASKISRGAYLKVGFLEGATYPDGTPVATVAAINNFGAPAAGVPARPFFTKMIAEKSKSWGEALVNRLKANDWDLVKSLEQMGVGVSGQLRQAIVDMNEPANSPVTNLLKQRFPLGKESGMTFDDVLQAWGDVAAGEDAPAGKPLVWSGSMLNAVDFEVTETGGG
jgi:hypothetical protein